MAWWIEWDAFNPKFKMRFDAGWDEPPPNFRLDPDPRDTRHRNFWYEERVPNFDEHMPSWVMQKNEKTVWPAFIKIGIAYGVDQRVKDAIEELERGVHCFHPVPMYRKNNEPYPVPYYIIDILQELDALDVANSPEKITRDESPYGSFRYSFSTEPRLAIFKERVKGRHLWWEQHTSRAKFCSNELMNLFQERKLTGLRAIPAIETAEAA